MEMLVTFFVLAVAVASLMSTFLGQASLNEQSRNLSWAMNDAGRVMEELRRQNTGAACVSPDLTPPAGGWDVWLHNAPGGKSLSGNFATDELVWVNPDTADDPEPTVVSVCWRYRGHVVGECAWNGAQLVANPGADGIVSSPAMLSTRMTCRR